MFFFAANRFRIYALMLCTGLLFSTPAFAGEQASTQATIESVIQVKRMLKVMHDPVPDWGWPKMKMKMPVAETVDLSSLKEGDRVTLTFEKNEQGKPVIVQVD